MAQQTIGIGAAPNDGTGDTIRDALDKANDNFNELYTAAAGAGAAASNDTTMAADSATVPPTQHAVRVYVANAVTGLLELKSGTDCSANPNYPAASKGDAYFVTVAGKIGGASGTAVGVGDVYFATADNAGGTQASVGSSWDVLLHSAALTGALLAGNNLSDLSNVATARTNLGATTVGASLFTLTNPSAVTFPRYNADNSVSALSASAFRTAIGAGVGGGDLVSTNNLSDLASAAAARTNLGLLRLVAFFFTSTPTTSEVLGLYVAADAFTLPANLSGSQVKVGTNATATFAIDVQQNGTSIGTISIATGGTATLTTTSGTSKSIAAGDVLKFVAPSTADTTIANVAVTLKGAL